MCIAIHLRPRRRDQIKLAIVALSPIPNRESNLLLHQATPKRNLEEIWKRHLENEEAK